MKKEDILMGVREWQRFEIAKRLIKREWKETEASEALGLSTRQIRRIKKRVKQEGAKGVQHRLKGKPSQKKIPQKVSSSIEKLYQETYEDFNISHFGEKLSELHSITYSRETIRQILLKAGIWKKRNKRRKHRKRRERRPREGEMLQMDGSHHKWLEDRGQKLVLIGAIDDATGTVPYAEFFDIEGTKAYLKVLREIVKKKGIFQSLYVDRAGHFFVNNTKKRREESQRGRDILTQIGRAMKELQVHMIPAYSPQAKGRIERLWGTFQDRLLKEMRLINITTKEEANKYLHREFLSFFNRKFQKPPREPQSAYLPLPPDINLSDIFCLKETRTVQKDHTISYHNTIYQLLPTKGYRGIAGAKVEVLESLSGKIRVKYRNTSMKIQRLPDTTTIPKEKKEIA